MKILVTGGAGFIGSHVTDAYIAKGYKVTIVDNLSTGRKSNINPKARFFEMDIRSPRLQKLLRQEHFEVINHHAAQIDVRKSTEDPAFDADINIIGTLKMLETAQQSGLQKFIFASSGGAIYGEQDYFPADEKHPTQPICPYGVAKLAIEKYLYYYHIQHHLSSVILRYANVYGPRQNPFGEAGVVAIFAERLKNNKPAIINGDGFQTRDYVFVEDVVTANVKALNYQKPWDILNIGTGVETDVVTIFRHLRNSIAPDRIEQHGPAKPGEQKRSVIDASLAQKVLGWHAAYDLLEGIDATVAYFLSEKQR